MLADQSRAVDEFFHRAAQVEPARWNKPRAHGKWSPAQEVKHVIIAYEAFTRDLLGGMPLRIVGTPFKRRIWRLYGLTWILRLGRIPRGAKATREMRPTETEYDQAELLAEFREC